MKTKLLLSTRSLFLYHVLTCQLMPQGNKNRNNAISVLAIKVKSVMALYQKYTCHQVYYILVWKVNDFIKKYMIIGFYHYTVIR